MAPTQDALYAGLDLDLSWSEQELPERERTKHVHRLHPYLGKFIPQLVEALLGRYVRPGGRVLDPFAGSGTTLVQSLESGRDARRRRHRRVQLPAHAGQDRALQRVHAREGAPRRLRPSRTDTSGGQSAVSRLFRSTRGTGSRRALPLSLLCWRAIVDEYEHADVLRVVLARAARSARLTTHFDLDFPRTPQRGPYWCHKHKRECRPVDRAEHFLRRYALDTLKRVKEFARVRGRGREATVLHGDSRELEWGERLRRCPHVPAVSGAHRLPRATPLRVRAARPRRPSRARARCGRVWDEPRRARRVRRGRRRRPDASRAGHSGRTHRCSSSSTTVAISTRRSSSERGYGSSIASAATSTVARAAAPASTSRTSSSRGARRQLA